MQGKYNPTGSIKIATINVRTLREDAKMVEMEYALENTNWDIIGLSEIRRNCEEFAETKDGHIFCHSSAENSNWGVGFIINKKWTKLIKEFKPISPRLAMLKLEINNQQIVLLQIYAPTSEYPDSETESFYEEIREEVLRNEDKNTTTIILGDFNASIGRMIQGEESVRGNSGFGVRNKRGSMLIEFAASLEMKIVNSYFGKTDEEKWTWLSPKKIKFEIDYFLIKNIDYVQKFYIQKDFKLETDHRMIAMELKIGKKRRYNNIKDNSTILKIKNSTEIYQDNLEEQLNKRILDRMEIHDRYTQIITGIREAVIHENQKAPQGRKRKISKKLSVGTKNLIEQREKLNKIINKSEEEKKEHSEIRKLTRRQIRKDVNNYEEEKIKQIIEETGSTKKLFKDLAMTRRSFIHSINHNNQQITDRDKIADAFADYFQEIYRSANPKPARPEISPHTVEEDNREEENLEITIEEINKAISNLKKEKTPGEDGITNELIKQGSFNLAKHICTLFNQILEENKIPPEWETSKIILLHKKGKKDQMENYRPISILPNMYKLFTKILQQKIEQKINNDQPEEQAGFRPSYSTNDHLQTINQIIEKCQEYNINLYLGFIDYSKAFDSIETKHIWPSLERAKIHSKIIQIFKTIYSKSKAKITLDKTSRTFNIEKGVRQGCPSSPNLFNCVLQSIFLEMEWKGYGLDIEGKTINNLRFADDIVIIAKSIEELKNMLEDLDRASQEKGLYMNMSKTKFMSPTKHGFLEINKHKIEQVQEYIYLGQLIALEERMEQELERRRTLAWRKFWSLKRILKSSVSIKIKSKILRSCVFPTLTYGCQTWALKKDQLNKVKSTQTTMYRSTLSIKKRDKIRNSILHERLKLEPIERTIKKLKLKWAGHVARQNTERWAKQSTNWTPMGRKRNKGRQRIRWEDEIKQSCGKGWQSTAQNREVWRETINTFTDTIIS